jgi:SSS family solute:Na+ symporter
MPSDIIKLLLLVAPSIIYFVFLVTITWRILKNREASTSTTFAKGRSDYTSSLLFYTLAATFVGPAYSLGVVDRAYHDTLLFTIIYVLATLHLLGTGLFLWFTRNQQAYTDYETVGDLMDERYGPIGRIVVGAFTTIQYTVFVAVLAVGGAEVLRVVFGLSPDATIALITLIVAGYTFTGGIPAVLQTDKLQFRFLFFIAIVALFTTFTIVLGDYNYINSEQVFNVRALPPEKLLALAVGFLLGEALQPFYITRVFMAPSAKDAGKAFVGTGIFGILWFSILGALGVALHGAVTVSPGTQALYLHSLPAVFGDGMLSTFLLGLLVAGFLGVVMSTMDSVLHSGAVSFIDDVLCSPVTLSKVSAEAKLTLMQLATILIALLGALIGSRGGDIVDLLLFAYTFWVPTIVPVLAYAFFWKNGSKKSVWVLLVPLFGGLVGYYLPSAWNYQPSIAAGFLANTILLIMLVQISNARRPSQLAVKG